MGMKPRKRSVVLWATRDALVHSPVDLWEEEPERLNDGFRGISHVGSLLGSPLAIGLGECRQVRVTIDEVE